MSVSIFHPLAIEQIQKIVEIQLGSLRKRLEERLRQLATTDHLTGSQRQVGKCGAGRGKWSGGRETGSLPPMKRDDSGLANRPTP